LWGGGGGGGTSSVELYGERHPHPSSPLEGEEIS
jgi:hypothetical protein